MSENAEQTTQAATVPPQCKVGVVIPTFNRPDLLGISLESLQEQTWKNWLAVVVNDASIADYSFVEERFAEDSRILFVRNEKNSGANASVNRGFDELEKHGVDYVTFLDDDDELAADYFSVALNKAAEKPEYGWYMSNNYGERKDSTRDIFEEGEFDWIDDYIYGKIRGDKAHLIASEVLAGVRMDTRFRASHRWPFYIDLGEKTRILAFPHDSIKKAYLEGGITRKKKSPKNWLEVYDKFHRHWYVIKLRPTTWPAYKYLALELLKTPGRLLALRHNA